jgi:two-component system, sensor histidine kinase RegB
VTQVEPAPGDGADPTLEGAQAPAPGVEANRIKLSWLVRLHWGAVVGQSLAIAVVSAFGIIHLRLGALAVILGAEVLANLTLDLWCRRAAEVRESAIAWTMFVDAVMITVILSFSGSYSNPFSTLYLVNVALAAVLLRPAWAWALLAGSLGLFGALFALDSLKHHGFALSEYDHMELMRLHMQGMWVAFAIAAVFLVYIAVRVTSALKARERELAEERGLSARKDKVAALATLAAGAAHELSTPLATIAVVTRELERAVDKAGGPQGAREDLDLIRQQLGRCQDILQQMSAHAGENAGEPLVRRPLREWIDAALAALPDRERVQVLGNGLAGELVEGPSRGLARALRSLIKNAVQASPLGAPVEVRLSGAEGEVRVEVVDRGPGMEGTVLSRAGEPFFTTKSPGEGMGLGLFLTRTLVEQIGGHLELESAPGGGTTARLRLPAALAIQNGGRS